MKDVGSAADQLRMSRKYPDTIPSGVPIVSASSVAATPIVRSLRAAVGTREKMVRPDG
jgi:hypothetical protein